MGRTPSQPFLRLQFGHVLPLNRRFDSTLRLWRQPTCDVSASFPAGAIGKSKGCGRPAANFALDGRQTTVKMGNGFYQGQTQTSALRAARRISAIETIEYAGNILCGYSTA